MNFPAAGLVHQVEQRFVKQVIARLTDPANRQLAPDDLLADGAGVLLIEGEYLIAEQDLFDAVGADEPLDVRADPLGRAVDDALTESERIRTVIAIIGTAFRREDRHVPRS